MRILFVQHGDYREAVERFAADGPETYYAQQYSVDYVAELATRSEAVGVLCLTGEQAATTLSDGVWSQGIAMKNGGVDEDAALVAIRDFAPTHLIVRYPSRRLVAWGIDNHIATLPLLADSFERPGLRGWFRQRALARTLNHQAIRWVSNHNVNASRSLAGIGVDPSRIVPWDWPSRVQPKDYPSKSHPGGETFNLFFAGKLVTDKGIGDAIEACAALRGNGRDVALAIAGSGDDEPMLRAAAEPLNGAVQFLGKLPHGEVVDRMHRSDAVIVPSRRAYPEGLPMVIYDAFASRAPLITSDHPMFVGKVESEVSGLVFNSGEPAAMATCVERLQDDAGLYERLSHASAEAWERLQCPVKWGDLIDRWLEGTTEANDWLSAHALASGIYD